MKRIFLIRHGQSEANVDKTILLDRPDHSIGLSAKGKEQAVACGKFLEGYLRGTFRLPFDRPNMRLWYSPYKRTKETKDGILNGLENAERPWCDAKEHPFLVEQGFGLFDGVPDEDLPKHFPLEHAHYKKCENFQGRFWAPMPLGESRFDVVQRVHQSFGTFQRDLERHRITHLIIVSHGVTLRAFLMMWCHKDVEWFENEPNPANCSIRLIENGEDAGYIFDGFKSKS